MRLGAFLPYRLAIVADAVSRSVSSVYAERFDLSRDEWRVLAALGESGTMKTREALLCTTLDKVQVSRALARMEGKGLVFREEDAEDRRNKVLRLTAQGEALYRRIVPLVQEREAQLLSALEPRERALLGSALDRILESARALARSD
ncbi:MAG: MarR family transcriptional regulator [Burkholderiales bacterium]|nr:MAG: MarR family transcriptional regulator [Burkholderiales bacterium]